MYGFIVNKTAGSGKGHRIWRKIETELHRNNVPYIVSYTEKPHDAVRLTDELLNSAVETVVVVGGDGTVSEAAEVLVHKDIPLGIVPAGSGNDFARSLGIPGNVKQALRRIFERNPKNIDVLQLEDRHCLTVTGIGIDGKVVQTVNQSSYKKWFNYAGLGRLTYFASVFKVLKSFEPTNVTLTIDGKKQMLSNVWLAAVANAPNYGGNISICPEAVNDDGRLNICVLQSADTWPLLRLVPKIVQGKHRANEHIKFFSGTDVYVHSDVPLLVQSDGEFVAETPVQVRIVKGALKVLS